MTMTSKSPHDTWMQNKFNSSLKYKEANLICSPKESKIDH